MSDASTLATDVPSVDNSSSADLPSEPTSRNRWIASAVVIAIFAILPQLVSTTQTDRIAGWFPMALTALSLALLTGFNGQISLGHGALYGVGAYTAAIAVNEWDFPYLGAMVLATIVAFVAGLVIGLPALRIKGLHLALVTLTVAMLFPQLINKFDDVTGGTTGLKVGETVKNALGGEKFQSIQFTAPDWTGLNNNQWRYYWLFAFTMLAVLVVRNIVTSRTGRALVAIRDNETAAAVSGINVAKTKVLTFGLSSALAGLAGSLYMLLITTQTEGLSSGKFDLTLSLYLLVAVVIGGSQSIAGPLIGTFIIVFTRDIITPELPKRLHELMPLIFGVSLITTMFTAPGGIVGMFRHTVEKFRAKGH